jgi:hypothetical protein
MNANDEAKIAFCVGSKDDFVQLYDLVGMLNPLIIFSCIGYLTAIIQKFTVLKLKDNVQISFGQICLEMAIVIVSGIFIAMYGDNPSNKLITSTCSELTTFNGQQSTAIDFGFALIA